MTSSATGWIDAFLEMMAVERAAARNTLTAYEKDLADARLFLACAASDLDGASAEAVEAYFADLGARGLSPATAARRRAALRQFYRFVLGEGWRDDDPVAPGRGAKRRPAPAQGAVARRSPAADRGGDRQGRRPGPAPGLHDRAALRLGPADLRTAEPAPGGPGPRSGLPDGQGQGRQGAAGPAERRGPRGGEGLFGGKTAVPAKGRSRRARGCSRRAARAGS